MKSNFKSKSSFFIRDILSRSDRPGSKYRNTDGRLQKKLTKPDRRNTRTIAEISKISKLETEKKHVAENANNHETKTNLFVEKGVGPAVQRMEYPLFALGLHPSYITPGNTSDDVIEQHFRSCVCGSTGCNRYADGHHIFRSPYLGLPPHDVMSIPIAHPVYMSGRPTVEPDDVTMLKRCRRSRTVFTELQLLGLEQRFENQKYLSTPDRMEVADKLGLSQLQVKTWYQNRRMKWKKQVMKVGGGNPPTKPKGRPKKNIDRWDTHEPQKTGTAFSETSTA